MKMHLPALAGFLIFGVTLTAMAGSDNAMKLVGVWEVTKSEGGAPPGAMLEFTKDGKFKTLAKSINLTIDGTYKVKEDKVFFSFMKGDKTKESTCTISKLTEKELHIVDQKGKTDEYKRVK